MWYFIKRISLIGSLLLVVTSLSANTLDKMVAVVNDGVITQSQLEDRVAEIEQQLRIQGQEIPQRSILEKQVLQQLILTNLQLQLAKMNNIEVDSTEVNQAITQIAKKNNSTLSQFRQMMEQKGIDWKAYRNSIKTELTLMRLQQKAVAKDVAISEEQVNDYLKTSKSADMSNQAYHLKNLVIPLDDEPSSEQLAKAEKLAQNIQQALLKDPDFSKIVANQKADDFLLEQNDLGTRHLPEIPELYAKYVAKMRVGQILGPIRAGNGLQFIKLLSIKGNDPHHNVLKTHVRHILIKKTPDITETEAENKAISLYQRLKSGQDFARLAKAYSADTVSGGKGGDLGWISPGETVPPFEEAMNKLNLNEVGKPVKTGFGWHIIQVLERKNVDDTETWRKQQVRQFLHQRKMMDAVQNWQQNLKSQAYVKILDKSLA
ncbi:peptidylprolyl isomerase [Legionella sp. W05-934-2]|jgi:peptidyl-prolyl cis-trans isomerase SurA|uniref:peptidylprolyl isomerase n=1 Tax=Legionella sp. W05-934-2 TaxID=1198649 RepID=UPI0034634E57